MSFLSEIRKKKQNKPCLHIASSVLQVSHFLHFLPLLFHFNPASERSFQSFSVNMPSHPPFGVSALLFHSLHWSDSLHQVEPSPSRQRLTPLFFLPCYQSEFSTAYRSSMAPKADTSGICCVKGWPARRRGRRHCCCEPGWRTSGSPCTERAHGKH